MAEGFHKYRRREAQRMIRQRDRARVRELRARVTGLRARRRAALVEVRHQCKAERERIRAEARALREETRRRLRETLQAMREAQRGTCSVTKARTRADLTGELVTAADELRTERERQEFEKNLDRSEKRRARAGVRSSAKERRQESDDSVRGNLPPELVPVFDKVKRQIRATSRMDRTEAFLQWAHDNPGDVLNIQQEHGQHAFLEELKKHEDELRAMQRRRRRRTMDEPRIASELAGVPF